MSFARILALLSLAVLGVYLFATAPPPLPEASARAADPAGRVPIRRVFDTVNLINAETRRIYTQRIVGGGTAAGLRFDEDWQRPDIQAGPLPALFLRLVAAGLEARPEPLGLFLGSDKPINPSNLFAGEQASRFAAIRSTGSPQAFAMAGGFEVAMYPDVASAGPCVTCHNEHADTPKRDWRLNDVMGATTWTYPAAEVGQDEFRAAVAAVYASIAEAYATYLDETRTFAAPPSIGDAWPEKDRRVLPDQRAFMEAVHQATAPRVLAEILAPAARADDDEVATAAAAAAGGGSAQ